MRMFRGRMSVFILLGLLGLAGAWLHAQTDSFAQHFKKFPDVAPGVDFFAAQRADVAPFEKPVNAGRQKLASLLGEPLAKGAIVICSTLAQKDSVNETRVLKMGYRWALIQLTPAAANEQAMAQMKGQIEQIKARMGGQLPPGLLDRLQSPSPEMKAAAEARLVSATVQRFGYAVLMTTLAPEKPFRSSRLEDMGRSPLADWLDIGLVAYATGGSPINMKLLQDRLEEAFPLEDFLEMSRPFVPPAAGGSGLSGGGPVVIQMSPGAAPPPPPGGAPPGPPSSGARPVGSSTMPKDVQDRMIFDAQSASFFTYIVNKIGLPRVKELVQWNRGGKSAREFLTRADVLGPDFDKVERDWQAWVKAQKVEMPGVQFITGPAPAPKAAPGTPSEEGKKRNEAGKVKSEKP